MTELEPDTLRKAFGAFMTGVTVVTTRDADGAPVGFTANSFTSVSMDPPLLLVCPGRFLSSFDAFQACGHFGVSILAEGQEAVSNTFASFKGDRFARVDWTSDAQDIPLISGAAAQFSCQTHQTIDAGDHLILLGKILLAEVSGRRGLGYAAGQYFSLGLERQSVIATNTGDETVAGAILEHDGKILLDHTPDGLCPPTTRPAGRDQLRRSVSTMFHEAGLEMSLGVTYSVYDDRKTGLRHIYFLGHARSDTTGGLGDWVAISDLGKARFTDPATASMLRRYAQEYETRTFGLYVGNDDAGDLAPLQERM